MISVIRLINIQSYEDVTFNLSDGINVFEAPNETGKSIIFKVFRVMCDANWYGRGQASSLIRRGTTCGQTAIALTKNDTQYIIVFNLFKTYQLYMLFQDGQQVNSWQQNVIPEELLDLLGWKYDKESKILMNLCDQELSMPFVDSNDKYNFESLRFITQDARLERARNTLSQELKELQLKQDRLQDRARSLEISLRDYKPVDINKMERSIDERKEIAVKAKTLLTILKSMDACSKLDKPEFKRIDEKSFEEQLKIITMIRTLGLTMQEAVKNEKPEFNIIDQTEVQGCITASRKLLNVHYTLKNVLDAVENITREKEIINDLQNKIKVFEETNEVCPLCGKPFSNHKH